jgi:hypothetical protein
VSPGQTPDGTQYRQCLLDLLGSIQNAQLALQRWDAAAFERAVTEQQRICDVLRQMKSTSGDRGEVELAFQVQAALRSYQLVVDRGTRWCRTLSHILGEPARQQSVNLRSEL